MARNCLGSGRSARQLCGAKQPAFCEMARQKLNPSRPFAAAQYSVAFGSNAGINQRVFVTFYATTS